MHFIENSVYIIIGAIILFAFQQFKKTVQNKDIIKSHQIDSLVFNSIKNQLDSHFTLNILNSLGFLYSSNNYEQANYLFTKYTKLTKASVNYSNQISVSLKEELLFVRDYLELEKFRHNNKFDFSIIAEEEINIDKISIPHMLIHTFTENAVKHGLKHLDNKEKGKLYIKVSKKSKHIVISIKDNGIGRLESKKYNKLSTGKGIEIVNEMTNLYNKLNNTKITYQITDLERGTEVVVILPT